MRADRRIRGWRSATWLGLFVAGTSGGLAIAKTSQVAGATAGPAPTAAQAAGETDASKPSAAARTPPWRLGALLWHDSPNDLVALGGIREALAEHGRAHEILVRQAAGDPAAAKRLLLALRQERVDLIFALGTQAALAAAEAIDDIPIVFTAVTNPVESGVVPRWEGSGRNVCGNSNWIPPETLLRAFRLAVPKLRRLGILRSSDSGVVSAAELSAMRRQMGEAPEVSVIEEVIDRPAAIAAAVGRLIAAGADAIWVPIDFTVYQNTGAVLAAAAPHGVPIVTSALAAARGGAVAGVLVDYRLLGMQSVVLALGVLEGGKDPGRLPVGLMQSYQTVVNLAAARRTRYELPLGALLVADLIEEGIEGERR